MKLITMIDDLLRNRGALYQLARERKSLASLSMRLLVVFLLTSAIYGGVMGAFRCLHPAYYFSDFELTPVSGSAIRGEVAGVRLDDRTVFTHSRIDQMKAGATIRFNTTNPTDAYTVSEIGEEKGFSKIVLAPGAALTESAGWLLPCLVALKIPLLFLLTLVVCALALYILNLAVGLQLHFAPSMALMLFALAGTGVVLVVFAPISLLFAVVTSSYHFMKIMHVLVFVVAGLFGVKILGEGLVSLHAPAVDDPHPEAPRGKVTLVLASWLLLYCLVGAQLAWTLKPFLGTPYLPATPPFRLENGNIFVSTMESMREIKSSE